MNKRNKSRKSDVTREEVKDLLDKEQLCLLKVKEKILQQIRVLQAEAATIQRLITVQEESMLPQNESPAASLNVIQDPSSGNLPELNLAVTSVPTQTSVDIEMESDSETDSG